MLLAAVSCMSGGKVFQHSLSCYIHFPADPVVVVQLALTSAAPGQVGHALCACVCVVCVCVCVCVCVSVCVRESVWSCWEHSASGL